MPPVDCGPLFCQHATLLRLLISLVRKPLLENPAGPECSEHRSEADQQDCARYG